MTSAGQVSKSSASFRNNVLFVLGLAALIFVVYNPAIHGGLLLDDEVMLNPTVQAPNGLYYIWCTTLLPDYFPLTYSSLWVEWHFWGTNLTGYHVTNVFLHVISAVLLWRVLAAMRVPGAKIAAVLFAVHPVAVESVAWISERKNVLAMPFFLATILFYLKATQPPASGHSTRKKFYVLSLVCFLLALLSKTAVVPLPFLLLVCDWWMGSGKKDFKTEFVRVSPFFLLALVMGLVTVWFQTNRVIVGDVVNAADFPTRLATAGRAIWFYLWKVFWPTNLTFIYPRWNVSAASLWAWAPVTALTVAVGLLFWKRRVWARPVLVGLGCFVALLLPVLGFINIYFFKYSLVADHWQYFAMLSPIVLVATTVRARVPLLARSGIIGGACCFVVEACCGFSQRPNSLGGYADEKSELHARPQ